MSKEQAIKKAIEGGYDMDERLIEKARISELKKAYHSLILLDPLFWQALGKAMGWNMTDKFEPNGKQTQWQYVEDRFMQRMYVFENTPMFHWHKFIDHLAEGKSINEFFEKL